MLFSQRYGFQPVRDALQTEGMDDGLRNQLWSVFHTLFFEIHGDVSIGYAGPEVRALVYSVWLRFLKQPSDTLDPGFGSFAGYVRKWWFHPDTPWWARYDLIENVVDNEDILDDDAVAETVELINRVLEGEHSGYRFVGRSLIQLTAPEQIEAVEQALEDTTSLVGVRHHLGRAVELLSSRQQPDFANSVKESVSAVEAMCRLIVGRDKATLGEGLKLLADAGVKVHPALKESFLKVYGYASDADGVRHAAFTLPEVTRPEATYLLVAASAFVSYLMTKAADAGIALKG